MSNKIIILGIIGIIIGPFAISRLTGNNSAAGITPSTQNSFHGQAAIGSAAGGSQLAPDFSLAKLGGGTISVAEFRGKKPVVVDFWASWCPNCRRDMPHLNSFYERYKDQIEVIGVNLQEAEPTVKDFIASRGISFPIALDPTGLASQIYGIQYTNTHFLIDKEGNLVRQIPGDIRESDIQSLIQ